jgi:hypothetical protein
LAEIDYRLLAGHNKLFKDNIAKHKIRLWRSGLSFGHATHLKGYAVAVGSPRGVLQEVHSNHD